MWNEQLKLPVPPLDAVANDAASFWATAIFGGLSLIVFLYGLKHWHATRRPLILLMMLGGALTTLLEPFLDVVGAAWHPEIGQHTAFTLMGRQIPWWVVAAYVFYFGVLGTLNYLGFEKKITVKGVWLWFSLPMVVDIFMEEVMLHWDLYYYYGEQPLIVFIKFPLWWAAANSIGEFIGICLIVALMPYLRGWKLVLVPLILPISDAIGYAAVAMPTWIAINTPVEPWVTQLAGVTTLALTAAIVHAIALFLAEDSPLKKSHALRPLVPGADIQSKAFLT